MTDTSHDSPTSSPFHLGNCLRHVTGITYLYTTVSHTYTRRNWYDWYVDTTQLLELRRIQPSACHLYHNMVGGMNGT